MSRFATAEGTRRFAERIGPRAAEGHFRIERDLVLSSIGIGTYLGEPDDAIDRSYAAALVAAARLGVNVMDSAISYRFQRSERAIGAALRQLATEGIAREELLLCSKGGFLTPDGDMPQNPGAYFQQEYFQPGIMRRDEVAGGSHCMAPRYLANQIDRSLQNLGVDAVDVYYIHNPESQLSTVPQRIFRDRLRAAFAHLEREVANQRIRWYGLATWNGFRQSETSLDFLALEDIVDTAKEIAGDAHHFRFVQIPFNLAMPEAIVKPNQPLAGHRVPMVKAANDLGITLIASASLLQGQVAQGLPEFVQQVLGLENDRQRALQFVRSAPGFTTGLVGMSRAAHVQENLALAAVAPLPLDQFLRIFHRT